jgi:hypothetical protein
LKLAIGSAEAVVAVIDWDGPLPRKGDYIAVPGADGHDPLVPGHLRAVLYVAWHFLGGEPAGGGLYSAAEEPYAEVMIS